MSAAPEYDWQIDWNPLGSPSQSDLYPFLANLWYLQPFFQSVVDDIYVSAGIGFPSGGTTDLRDHSGSVSTSPVETVVSVGGETLYPVPTYSGEQLPNVGTGALESGTAEILVENVEVIDKASIEALPNFAWWHGDNTYFIRDASGALVLQTAGEIPATEPTGGTTVVETPTYVPNNTMFPSGGEEVSFWDDLGDLAISWIGQEAGLFPTTTVPQTPSVITGGGGTGGVPPTTVVSSPGLPPINPNTGQPYKNMKWDPYKGKWVRCRRRRRKLLTDSDYNALLKIQTLKNNQNMQVAIAKALGR